MHIFRLWAFLASSGPRLPQSVISTWRMPERIMAAQGKWKCDRWDKNKLNISLVNLFSLWHLKKGDSFQLCYLWVMLVHFDFQVQHFEQTMFALFSKYALVVYSMQGGISGPRMYFVVIAIVCAWELCRVLVGVPGDVIYGYCLWPEGTT